MVEQVALNHKVTGSSPVRPTTDFERPADYVSIRQGAFYLLTSINVDPRHLLFNVH